MHVTWNIFKMSFDNNGLFLQAKKPKPKNNNNKK